MEFQRKTKEKRFGLSYMGSKSRFWRWLLRRIPACGTFYDLFAGGCSVGHMMGHFGKCEKVVFNDVDIMPLELFRMAINGTLPPPTWMSHEEFREHNRVDDMRRYPHQFNRLKKTVAKIAETSKCFPNDPKGFIEWWLSDKSVQEFKAARLPFHEVDTIVDLSFK